MNPQTFQLDPKSPLICPYCAQHIIHAAGITPGHSGTIRKDQLFVCASCGQASIVGDSNLQQLTKEKFDTLPSNVQKALGAIVNTLQDMNVSKTQVN